ncbi:DNA repair protein RecO [Thiomicrospira sp. ALE5]|uniref:DNA repair protein RecO n=1 Tax=Thiomicrospira sp. ALE5 TaxID=748650 RepID=UPI0008F459B0|nr:recombination protein O N-terminal domain-containing protein [Thiomicrospira sp. ALE5]SFR49448.1 DNA replication and repair protein RecO [Thiomicrospira sp. ALE5]
MSVIQQPAYVLHSRPYKETSVQVTLLMPQQGKRFATFRGVRQASKAARQKQAWLQPFQPLQVAWQASPANQDWLMPNHLEAYGQIHWLEGEANLCGLYLNELLYLCLPLAQPCETLFVAYIQTLQALSQLTGDLTTKRQQQAGLLRHFELHLLQELGYPLQAWLAEQAAGFVAAAPIDPAAIYRLRPQGLPVYADHEAEVWDLPGYALLALVDGQDWTDKQQALVPLKRFFRAHLNLYLAGRPLGTRHLLQASLTHAKDALS